MRRATSPEVGGFKLDRFFGLLGWRSVLPFVFGRFVNRPYDIPPTRFVAVDEYCTNFIVRILLYGLIVRIIVRIIAPNVAIKNYPLSKFSLSVRSAVTNSIIFSQKSREIHVIFLYNARVFIIS